MIKQLTPAFDCWFWVTILHIIWSYFIASYVTADTLVNGQPKLGDMHLSKYTRNKPCTTIFSKPASSSNNQEQVLKCCYNYNDLMSSCSQVHSTLAS